ncbi:DeoR/GlpR family DNA-binding transcription regulator [Scrofimicrobium sp. R131]|uniref:DeoR/GlpR family DNA-binding transcription regulator n=1 Tax=Scrofimicrobium appendicitidis TaxID=3079930 RepID=A0AAU7V8X0_9ACTO
MIPAQRQARILEHIRRQGGVSVGALAAELSVSPSTIRRDLNHLDREGVLRRVRGGGTIETDPTPFKDVASVAGAEREALGRLAADLVEDRQVVLLDIGTTVAMVARHLRDRPVTVVTASLAVVDELRDSSVTEVIVLGGVLRPSYLSLVGPMTQGALDYLAADVAFLGTSGIAPDLTVLDTTGTEVPIKQAIMRKSARNYLLAIADKFPGSGLLPVCSATEFDAVLTTADPEIETLRLLRSTTTEVITP